MPKEKLFDTEAALKKAMELFWRKGFHGTSINDLVEATGLSRSSLYATYQDKYQLYRASLNYYQVLNSARLTKALAKNSSAVGKIEFIFNDVLNSIVKSPYGRGCFMVNTATEMANQDTELARLASDDFSGIEELFHTIIQQGQEGGEIDKKLKARALANYFASGYLGLRIMGQAKPDKEKLEDVIRITLSSLNK